MYATADLPQLIDHAQESRGHVRDLVTDLLALVGCRRKTQSECQREEALLCAVVEVALDPAAGLIRCRDDARTGGYELGPALRVRDRGGDQVGELRRPSLGVGRQWSLPGPDGDRSPQPAVDVYRHGDRGPYPLAEIGLPVRKVPVVIDPG